MERKNNITALLFLLVALFFVGCKSTKTVQRSEMPAGITLAEIEAMPAVKGALPGYSAKMKLTLASPGKTFSSQGTLRLKDGEGVQMGITPLGLFEVARVEFSPLYVLIMNRLKKEYSLVHYRNVALLEQLGLNYTLLESVLQNRVNLPAGVPVEKALAAMDITLLGDTLCLTNKAGGITYDYYIAKSSGLLVKSVGKHGNGTAVTCLYEGFRPIGGQQIPHSITLALGGTANAVELSIVLNKVKEELEYNTTAPSSSYKKVPLTDIFEALNGK
ncbi:MAG: DUF4292 domain-containing protein [Bacteroidaceae bacterium]|nr:DUF4292 domain-containing protein [Bacteroidaceae bacterium]